MDPLLEVANASRNQVWCSGAETLFTDEGMERAHALKTPPCKEGSKGIQKIVDRSD